ncbi:hypothetical protein KEJ48_04855 [Candidatus Bathyarchaeota archaeon]|nr:hypothetical protein [Candidatus Bathyarchaeota archaeon]
MEKYVIWKDHRWIYLLLIVVVSVPLINPIGLPVPVSKPTKMSFEVIERLPRGSKVLVSSVLAGGNWPDLGPPETALVQHLFRKNMKIFFIGFVSETPTITETTLLPRIEKYGAKYGEDYVNLGFLAGGESAMAAFASDIRKVITVDFFGTPIDNLPIMKNIYKCSDFDLVIHIGMAEDPIRQYYTPFKIPLIVGVYGMMGPHYIPYLEAGQLQGMIIGLRGSAEYEYLLGFKGEGLMGSDALSMTHLLVAVFCILGNVYYFATKIKRRRSEQ